MQELEVQIWSDIACPWCSVGKRRFEAALVRFPEREAVRVRWRSFELNPDAPRVETWEGTYADRLARKYGVSVAQGQAMVDQMTAAAAAEGLRFRFDLVRPGNTFDAHRLLHHAAPLGLEGALKERLLVAYMGEGRAIGERDVLVELATEVGLQGDEVRSMLEGDEHGAAVRADQAEARTRGIGGVPHFLIGDGPGLSGAQPAEVLLHALRTAWRG